jgi:hypothetical protein
MEWRKQFNRFTSGGIFTSVMGGVSVFFGIIGMCVVGLYNRDSLSLDARSQYDAGLDASVGLLVIGSALGAAGITLLVGAKRLQKSHASAP